MKNQICIVAIGYNRPEAMKRLLNSLGKAVYSEAVDLVISVDKGDNQKQVVEVGESFTWNYGEKTVRHFDTRQGLRKHVLSCGDLSYEYRAVVLLEDDITVSPGFFQYVLQCLSKYQDENKIAGISLYSHKSNIGARQLFDPAYNGYDVFMMQFAQSWGQCWTSRMWDGFRKWYDNNFDYFSNNVGRIKQVPIEIINWDEHSWLKYYMGYIAENDLYFVYPYYSLSTNHSEIGQHRKLGSNSYMTNMNEGIFEYRLPSFNQAIKYDMYFERANFEIKNYPDSIIDLYGRKTNYENHRYLISTNSLGYKIVTSWSMNSHPREYSCIDQEPGDTIFVYDLSQKDKIRAKINIVAITLYDTRMIHWKSLLLAGLDGLVRAIKNRL